MSLDRRSVQVAAALLVAVSAIAFAAIFFRKASPTHPLVAAGFRLALTSLLVLPLAFRSWRQGRVTAKLVGAAVVGGFAYAVHFGAWVSSLSLTSVASSVTLVTATPMLLAVVALFTGRDRPSRMTWLALGVASTGLLVIGSHDLSVAPEALVGDLLALLGAAAMAGYMLNARRLGDALDIWAFAFVATATGAAVLATTAVGLGVAAMPGSEAVFYLVLAALIPQMIGHNLITWCLKHTSPTTVGIAVLGEPIGASLLGWLWLEEPVAGWGLVGCALTLVGVGIGVYAPRRPKVESHM